MEYPMKQITNKDLSQEVFDLFDSYVHNGISRREFMDNVKKYAVGGLTATAIFNYLAPKYAEAQQIKADDPRVNSEFIEYVIICSRTIEISTIIPHNMNGIY